MRVAFDTNILAYSEGADDTRRQTLAGELVVAVQGHELIVPVQVTGEFFHFLTRKKKMSREAARDIVASWQALISERVETTATVFSDAMDLAVQHDLQIFDAMILAASASARCRMLLSEDMQDGFVWRGVTVVNPFASTRHPMLVDLLRR